MKVSCLTNIIQVRGTLTNNECDVSAQLLLFHLKIYTCKLPTGRKVKPSNNQSCLQEVKNAISTKIDNKFLIYYAACIGNVTSVVICVITILSNHG